MGSIGVSILLDCPLLSSAIFATDLEEHGIIILTDIEADPDGDNLSFIWFDYPEAGTYKKTVSTGAANNAHAIYYRLPLLGLDTRAFDFLAW